MRPSVLAPCLPACLPVASMRCQSQADGATKHVETHAPPIWWFKTAKATQQPNWAKREASWRLILIFENLIGILMAFDLISICQLFGY